MQALENFDWQTGNSGQIVVEMFSLFVAANWRTIDGAHLNPRASLAGSAAASNGSALSSDAIATLFKSISLFLSICLPVPARDRDVPIEWTSQQVAPG